MNQLDPNHHPVSFSPHASQMAQLVLDSLNEPVFAVDRSRRITSFNRAAERLLGVSRQRVLGRCCDEVFAADRCQDGCPLRATLASGEPRQDERVVVKDCWARELEVCVTTNLLRDERGRPVGAVELLRSHCPPPVIEDERGSADDGPPSRFRAMRPSTRAIMQAERVVGPEALEDPEARRLAELLQAHGWRRSETASALGISRSTLWRRMKEFGFIP